MLRSYDTKCPIKSQLLQLDRTGADVPAEPGWGSRRAQRTGGRPTRPAPAARLFKNPRLVAVIPGLLGGADENCNKAATPPTGQPNLIICEEVRLNGASSDYIAGTNLWNRGGQAAAAANGANIQFSPPSVEIKADWISLTSIGLNCSSLPAGFTQTIHVETINVNCFGLAGMHLISKLQTMDMGNL